MQPRFPGAAGARLVKNPNRGITAPIPRPEADWITPVGATIERRDLNPFSPLFRLSRRLLQPHPHRNNELFETSLVQLQ
jgi:hypothetical protein